MKQLMFIFAISILLLSNPFAAKAETSPSIPQEDKWYESIQDINKIFHTGHIVKVINGVEVDCIVVIARYPSTGAGITCLPPVVSGNEQSPDPGGEDPEETPTICNGCPNINVSPPMRTFKNKKFKTIR